MPTKTYKIGARGSLLSVTQSTLTKNILEQLTGDKFEIITIKTQGDQITDKPLWQLEGKDFFTKELDEALIANQVDLVIHSYKDLGSIRPEQIKLAAITKRSFAHDILLIKKETVRALMDQKLSTEQFIVGTSSPRRIVNIEKNLHRFIPGIKNKKVKCETLRGNVNTRIQKLLDNNYHAIILAMAGIERLAQHPNSLPEITRLTQDLNFCILPLSEFPSAASQGALAIEINANRNDHQELENKIAKIDCSQTREEMKIERARFQSYGGGCHLAVGIHARKIENQFVLFEKGEVDHKEVFSKQYWPKIDIEKIPVHEVFFTGMPSNFKFDCKQKLINDEILIKKSNEKIIQEKDNIFVSSSYCIKNLNPNIKYSSIWSAGLKTHQKLVEQGFWVNGCCDVFGEKELTTFKTSSILNLLLASKKWTGLTNAEAISLLDSKFVAYEKFENSPSAEYLKQLQQIKHFYWTSFHQFKVFAKHLDLTASSIRHYCGPGKTKQEFAQNQIPVQSVLSINDILN